MAEYEEQEYETCPDCDGECDGCLRCMDSGVVPHGCDPNDHEWGLVDDAPLPEEGYTIPPGHSDLALRRRLRASLPESTRLLMAESYESLILVVRSQQRYINALDEEAGELSEDYDETIRAVERVIAILR